MVQTKSPRPKTTSGRSESSSGFTLIEILIVLAIISLVMSVGLPAIDRVTYQRVNSTARQFIGTIRTIRNDSILLNRVHRLVLDLDEKTWWVETQREFRLLTDETAKKEEKEPPPSNFALADKYSKEPVNMPSNVVFDGVLTERAGLRREGIVYVHFFPNGYNEQAIFYLNKDGADKTRSYSLLIRPTSGRVEFHKQVIRDFESGVQ